MPSRFRSRQQALQTLFLWDVRKQPMGEVLDDYYGSLASEECVPVDERDVFSETLSVQTVAHVEVLDALIVKHSQNWRIERMPVVDRNILRLAIYEMKYMVTPAAVVIDQALELARRFAGDDSIAFLNGVLDAVNRELHP